MLWTSTHFLTELKSISSSAVQGRCAPVTMRCLVVLGFAFLLYSQQVLAGDNLNAHVTFSKLESKTFLQQTATLSKTRLATKEAPHAIPQDQKKKQLVAPPVRPKIALQTIVFEGNTAVSDLELHKLSLPYLNRPLRYSDLEQLRIEITRAYTDRGYINSGAVLPEQKVQNGQLVYRLIEGRLDNIEVTGSGRLKTQYVTSRLRSAMVGPFNSEKLTQAFQLLLNDPVIERMDGQLVPMPDSKSTSLKLNVTPAEPWKFDLTLDNHGSPSVGTEQLTLAGTYLNLTGYGDTVGLSLNGSPGRYGLSATYSIPLNSRDTRLAFDLGTSNSAVIEAPLDDIDIESNSASFGLSLSHPLRRTLTGSVRFGVDLTVRNSSNSLLDQPFSFSPGEENGESRVAAIRIWQNFTRRTEDQVIALRSSFNFGIDAFGSTIHEDDRPDSEFFAWLAQAQFVRSFHEGDSQLLMRVDAQLTDDTLLPLERFALGGAVSVRGYRKNQLVRDQATFASLEYRYKLHHSPTYGSWQFAPFLDYGSARGEAGTETLFSAGAGLLWSNTRYNAELYVGRAIDEVNTSSDDNPQDDGVHFRFSTRF